MRNLHEAIGILLRENDKLPNKVEYMTTSAEHDVIYLGGPKPESLSEAVVARLGELHVHWDDEYDCWRMFS